MTRFKVVFAEAWRSLTASLATTLAATMTVLIGMFLVGLLIGLGTWARSWSDSQKDKLLVEAFLCTEATCKGQGEVTPRQINAISARLDSNPLVDSYEFVSKAEALKIMEQRAPELTENLPANPLPASFKINPKRGEDVGSVAASLEPLPPGVEKVDYGRKTANRILRVARIFEVLSILGILILVGSATILIGNTIRLSIFARRREIEVMKLVGASNWFVRGPFVVEGLLCGLIGSVAAVMLLFLGRELVLPSTIGRLDAGDNVDALAFHLNALIVVSLGLLLGAVGSGMTMRRFLHV